MPLAAAWGGPLLKDALSTCATVNCNVVSLAGRTQPLNPFVIQVYAAKDECLRLDVDNASDDLAMTIVSPDPQRAYFNDDDVATASNTPLVKIDPVPVSGWHTVHVNGQSGQSGSVSFRLRYGRYPGGNANCANPTAPADLGGA